MTFIAALRHDAITAPWVIDGPINGSIFQIYVEQVLTPTLRPGDIVIPDNLGSCCIPAHCIDALRLPLFIARSALRDLIAGLRADAKGVRTA